eukprot:365171-Chlamydomonas_euryale.AAC.6
MKQFCSDATYARPRTELLLVQEIEPNRACREVWPTLHKPSPSGIPTRIAVHRQDSSAAQKT